MGLIVATPYRETSIGAIATCAASRGDLDRFFTTLALSGLLPAAARLPGTQGVRLRTELSRRQFADLPPDAVETVATTWELVHVGLRRVGAAPRASRFMHEVKRHFDAGVASRIPDIPDASTVTAQVGSARRTFAAARAADKRTVLNFVNSHPTAHNRSLRDLAGLPRTHHEMVPERVIAEVNEELTLADEVLVPSVLVRDQLRAEGVEDARLALEPYGIDLAAHQPAAQRGMPRSGGVRCLTVGQISFRKGTPILLAAARFLASEGVTFDLVGPMTSRAVYREAPSNVRWLGARAPSGVPAAMQSADIFVLPSLQDAYALVILEAMAAGLPVVTTTNTGASELIQDGVDGVLVPPGDVGALAGAISELAADPERRVRMGASARRRVEASSDARDYGDRVLRRVAEAGAAG